MKAPYFVHLPLLIVIYITFDLNPFETSIVISDTSRPRVSGKYTNSRIVNSTQVTEHGRKAKAPHAFDRRGKNIPTTKLHPHDDKLPSAIADGRELSSNSSRDIIKLIVKNKITNNIQRQQ